MSDARGINHAEVVEALKRAGVAGVLETVRAYVRSPATDATPSERDAMVYVDMALQALGHE